MFRIAAVMAVALVAEGCDRAAPPSGEAGAPESVAALMATIAGPDSSTEFGSVRSVLLDRDGAVYVVDTRNTLVFRFDSLGRLDRQLGRAGAGPGEYRDPYSLAWLGDTLALLDPANARIQLYARDGTPAGTLRSAPISGDQFVRLHRTPPDGFWGLLSIPRDGRAETGLVHYGAGGSWDTLLVPREPEGAVVYAQCDLPDKSMTFFTAPFAPRWLVAPTAKGELAVAASGAYRIAFLSNGGDTARVLARPWVPVPVSDREWEAGNAEFTAWLARNPAARCNRTAFDRPAVKPPLQHFFHDAEGRFWVELLTPDGVRYDVFDAGGGFLRRIGGLPASGGIDPSARNGRIAFVVRDSLDVPAVQLYRIEPR